MYSFRFGFVTYKTGDEAEKAVKEVTNIYFSAGDVFREWRITGGG
jgi:hypothetical protein